jgi:hypothetical protein
MRSRRNGAAAAVVTDQLPILMYHRVAPSGLPKLARYWVAPAALEEQRAILERELETPVRAFAYPYGDCDRVVQHLIGACGYVFGFSCMPGRSRFQDSLLALPRIEVAGTEGLQEFVAKLG